MYYQNNNQLKFKEINDLLPNLTTSTKNNNRFLKIALDNYKAIKLMRNGKYK